MISDVSSSVSARILCTSRTVFLALILIPLGMVGPPAAAEGGPVWIETGRLLQPSAEPVKVSASCLLGPHPVCGRSTTDFGGLVAVDGETAVVGSPQSGRLHIYELQGGIWRNVRTFDGPSALGNGLSIADGTIVAGFPEASQLWVLQEGPDGWVHTNSYTGPTSGCFGKDVDQLGLRVVVGDSCRSAVHVLEFQNGELVETAAIQRPDPYVGFTVAAHPDGFFTYVHPFAIHQYRLNDGAWASSIVASEVSHLFTYGQDTIAVAVGDSVRTYEANGTAWSETARLRPSDASFFESGAGVKLVLSLSGDHLAIGAVEDDPGPGVPHGGVAPITDACISQVGTSACLPPRPGAVYIYERDNDLWRFAAKIASESAGDHRFGGAVSISPDQSRIFVGSPYKLLSSVGSQVDVDPVDGVHIFERRSLEA